MPSEPSEWSADKDNRSTSWNPYRRDPAESSPPAGMPSPARTDSDAQLVPRISQHVAATHKRANAMAEEVRAVFGPTVSYGEMERFHAFTPGRKRGSRDSACAPVTKRIGAQVLDVAFFCGLYLAALLVVALGVDTTAVALSHENLALIGILAAPGAYYVWQTLWDSTGGSLGKRALGLRVVAPADSPVSTGAAAKRNLWLLLNYIPIAGPVAALGVGSWLAGSAKVDAFGMAAHDRNARLRVVDAAKARSVEGKEWIGENRGISTSGTSGSISSGETPAIRGRALHSDADDAR